MLLKLNTKPLKNGSYQVLKLSSPTLTEMLSKTFRMDGQTQLEYSFQTGFPRKAAMNRMALYIGYFFPFI